MAPRTLADKRDSVMLMLATSLALVLAQQEAFTVRADMFIRQLGHPLFTQREAAQDALLAMGERVVPLLEHRRAAADLETQRRIDRIRYQLVGYAEDILAFLAKLPSDDPDKRVDVPAYAVSAVALAQPKSGDLLLRLIADEKHKLRRAAVRLFCVTWTSASAAQLERYFQAAFVLKAYHRDRYPRGVPAMIEMRYYLIDGWLGFPKDMQWQTTTTHYLDGKPHGRPYNYGYPGPAATTGWIKTDQLAEGRHTLHSTVEYEVKHPGGVQHGKVRSPDYTFEVIPADAPNDLIAAANTAVDEQVKKLFVIREHERDEPGAGPIIERFPEGRIDPWQPQITWTNEAGKPAGLHVPMWKLSQALPVDLCWEVEMREVATGKTWPCDVLIAKRGKIGQGYFTPREARAFCAGRAGFVDVELRLTPSRAWALSDPDVTSYYPGSITRRLRCKVFTEVPASKTP
jgi:hypothetical protein